MPKRLLVVVACGTAVLAIACGSSSSPKAASSSATTGSSTSSSTTTTVVASSSSGTAIHVTVKGGKVDGGVQTTDVSLGATVDLVVDSDIADEVHVHGYDKKGDVEAGGSVTVTFAADIPGQFEVELENAHLKILELRVS